MERTDKEPEEKPRVAPDEYERRAEASPDPDVMEEELREEIDDVVPTRGYRMLPIVGLGGSAGSLVPMEQFFKATPPKSGLAFAVVVHLSPDHESLLSQILARATAMPVLEARDGMLVEANHVYVIPPGKHLLSTDGRLRLVDMAPVPGRRVAVDLFFRSLADTHGPHATAVVLSGVDGDGAVGIKRIKERGGLTVAQEPEDAEHHGMPQSAIATGMVDWVLPAAEMPMRIIEYFAREAKLRLPPEDGPQPVLQPPPAGSETEAAMRDVLAFLQARTGRDFSYYKRATIVRRISRRMQINGVEELPAYLGFLRTHPGEAGALLQDLLISVTNFFRDRTAFEALELMIPELFEGKHAADAVRVWVPACATGEEAYSIAMLLLEHARRTDGGPSIQVFGCDLDEEAVQVARVGVYPETIAADVSEERLRRFFVKDHRGYRVRRELREIILFAGHDLVKDPPFSRMDLISCRNLLIYLNRPAQRRAIDIFNFALRPHGLLFLGSSESVEDGSALFDVCDKKHRIYRQQPNHRTGIPVPTAPGTLIRNIQPNHRLADGPVLPGPSFARLQSMIPSSDFLRSDLPISHAELHLRLVEAFGPPSVLINGDHEVVHVSPSAGRFLQFAGGEPSRNLLRVVHPKLRVDLRGALFQAAESGQPAAVPRLPIDVDGIAQAVSLTVTPAADLAPGFFVVTFETSRAEPQEWTPESGSGTTHAEPLVGQLERELERMKGRLRDTVEQYEASTEELKASNEELQAMNEELRSATEELETSREELQSINEELSTVNQELKAKVDELGHTNSDLHNLMASTAIATVFLNRELNIMRYTPMAVSLFHLIPSDIGRPLADLKYQIDYPELTADAERVLDSLMPIEREVGGPSERWYLSRLLPYRTVEDHIAGVVLTFIDITERRRAEEALKRSEERLALELADANELHRISSQFVRQGDTQILCEQIVDAAIRLARADAGSLQMFEPETHELQLLAWRGFKPESAAAWNRLESGAGTGCTHAVEKSERVIVPDVEACEWLAGSEHLRHFRLSGIRSFQSTPLISRTGGTIGVISTHWRVPRTPSERELRLVDMVARQAADLVERRRSEESLRSHIDELTRFNTAAVGRENRMIQLKREINSLCERLGEPLRYQLPDDVENGSLG